MKSCGRRILPLLMPCFVALSFTMDAYAYAWEPASKHLDTAIKSGDFTQYSSNVSAWLNQKAPSRISRATMLGLLKDKAFVNTLCQRQLIAKVRVDDIDAFAKAGETNQRFLMWLLNNSRAMGMYLKSDPPSQGEYLNSLKIWNEIYHADPGSRSGIYLKLAIGTCLAHATPIECFGERGVIDPVSRYAHFKTAHLNDKLFTSFNSLSVWEYRKVVDSQASDLELAWAREMLRTFRPDLVLGERVVRIVSEVHRKRPEWGLGSRTFPKLINGGGKCGPRSWFGRMSCRAFGIPVWGTKFPGHACTGYLSPGGWRTAYGGKIQKSKWDGQTGVEFLAEAEARSHEKDFSQAEHLRWLADAMTSEKRAKTVRGVAAEITKLAAAKPKTEAKREGLPIIAPIPSEIPPDRRNKRPGVLHIEAAEFTKKSHTNVHECMTGGKQIYFPKIGDKWGDEPQVEYVVEVPATGMYGLTMRTAAVNLRQAIEVECGSDLTVNVPYTRGLWGTTPEVDMPLREGKQTLTLTRPRPHRGVALRWLELKLKDKQ